MLYGMECSDWRVSGRMYETLDEADRAATRHRGRVVEYPRLKMTWSAVVMLSSGPMSALTGDTLVCGVSREAAERAARAYLAERPAATVQVRHTVGAVA